MNVRLKSNTYFYVLLTSKFNTYIYIIHTPFCNNIFQYHSEHETQCYEVQLLAHYVHTPQSCIVHKVYIKLIKLTAIMKKLEVLPWKHYYVIANIKYGNLAQFILDLAVVCLSSLLCIISLSTCQYVSYQRCQISMRTFHIYGYLLGYMGFDAYYVKWQNGHYDITIGNFVTRNIHYDVTMSNDIAMCTYHGITTHNDIAMNFFYYVQYGIKTRTGLRLISLIWRTDSLFMCRAIALILQTCEISLHKNNLYVLPD